MTLFAEFHSSSYKGLPHKEPAITKLARLSVYAPLRLSSRNLDNTLKKNVDVNPLLKCTTGNFIL